MPGVAGVFLGNDFVTVTKTDAAVWDQIKPSVLGAIMEHYQSGQPALAEAAHTFKDLLGEGAKVTRGEGERMREERVDSFRAAMKWLIAEAERTTTRQRYKGLGEMNPEQLWETTLDPVARTMLQVRIEDVAEAEDIFSKLMGDVVEPRRDFIQTNALSVENLDT